MSDTFVTLEGSPPAPGAQQAAHTRTYQACIPCRKRKVRCNLGPVDNPHDPPCDRCRRESKECFFSATRRKKRAADSGAADEVEPDDFEIRGGRKRLKGEDDDANEVNGRGYSAFPLTPGGIAPPPRLGHAHRPTLTTSVSYTASHPSAREEQEDEQLGAHTAAILQNAEVHSGHDALKTLLEAATTQAGGSNSTSSRQDGMPVRSPHDIPTSSPGLARRATNNSLPPPVGIFSPGQPQVDPALNNGPVFGSTASATAAEHTAALKAWSRFRFVRAGWFSAREAIDYVNFFYTDLSPLTPIVMPEYASLGSHAALLENEPMLAVTILTIASRHMKLTGPGSQSRPYAIHQKLWSYLEGMINRLVWGQEQFNSGTPISGQFGSDIVPYFRKGLRTLGTVESLMLLTEWHPRSMHFPPDDDDSELMMPEPGVMQSESDDGSGDSVKGGIGGQRIDTWLEPCWRSDRICWMLLSMAMSLAFEIGVFDEDTARHMAELNLVSEDKIRAYDRRRLHVKDLLLVYTTQTSGRVGLITMLPKNYCDPALSHIFDLRNIAPGQTKEMVIHLWLKIAAIMKTGNEELFANRTLTRDIIRTGRYKELLQGLYPVLTSWRRTLDMAKDIPALMRHVLVIDYEYCRVYLNSLGLQAVVERCTQNVHQQKANAAKIGSNGPSDGSIPASVLEKCYGSDRFYINEVTDGCRKLLAAVVDGLYPGEHLRHAPVRTYFRIISVAIILLKTFALGATEDDVAISLGYLDRTIEALQSCIVDDVHVASRFADLLDTLTCRIRQRFVRLSRGGQSGMSRGTSKSPADVMGIPTSQPVNPSQLRKSLNNQQWSGHPAAQFHNGARDPSHSGTNTNNSNSNNPLWGISTQTFDLDENVPNFSVMPPPTNPSSPVFTRASLGPNGHYTSFQPHPNEQYGDEDMPDWLALPLDPILNSYGADVTQNGYGPGVGEYDMLELLLNGSNNNTNN
ncbi:hypothetical protein K461DRAFT_325727 [Myriangium duriaei CBS 260.36]|uniref:Zn(2)-C6 fungal-type domain-containing protein n=1 Tax=Myriangium duriaei CBS 260.36 TaxID=1168546 RepID=A0A9P4J8D4_9PEZI|nr:hypothetical protein K461DRAFT_325727 [Myriangium duriaei CBS 260.36]